MHGHTHAVRDTLLMLVVQLVFRTILVLRRWNYLIRISGKELTNAGCSFLATPRRPPLRAAMHMNASRHLQREYRRTTDRTSYNRPSPDDGMAHG
jgi:hypothetical protein